MLLNSKKVDIGMSAKDFELKNVDNEIYTLSDIKKRNGFVIAFICNHCPYVKDIIIDFSFPNFFINFLTSCF